MIIDRLLRLSNNQAVNTTGTHASTDIHDLVSKRDMAPGTQLEVHCKVATAFLTTNAGTITVALQGSTDASTWTTMMSGPTVAAADAVVGADLFPNDLPGLIPGQALPRYLRFLYTVANAFTQSGINAAIVLDKQQNRAYPAGYNVTN